MNKIERIGFVWLVLVSALLAGTVEAAVTVSSEPGVSEGLCEAPNTGT